jgi:PST family polysaccharide transporter/lipopolysaccharide exporter
MVPAMKVLCIFGITRSIGASMGPILISLGKPGIQTTISGIQLIMMIIIIYPLTILWGFLGTSVAVTISNLAALLLITTQTKNMIKYTYKDFIASFIVPFFASFLAGSAIILISKNIFYAGNIFALLIMTLLFVVIYSGIVYLFDLSRHKITDTIREVLINLNL